MSAGGGPAFPVVSDEFGHYSGMDLRDYFAGQALVGFLTAPGEEGRECRQSPARASEWAYDQADAMLAAREATP